MKKSILFLFVMMLLTSGAFATLTYNAQNYLDNVGFVGSGNKQLDPVYLTISEIDTLIGGTAGTFGSITLAPGTAPGTPAEGMIYYNDISNVYQYYNGSAWVNIEANTGGLPLDLTYDLGNTITVDNGAITLTTGSASNNPAIAIAQTDLTNNPKALTLTNAGSGNTIDIQGTSGKDIEGTGDTWNVTTAGVGTFVGLVTSTGDVTFTGANYNIIHDASADQLEFKDSAKLVFGTSDDMSIAYDGSGNDLDILGSGLEIAFGANDEGIDVILHGETALTNMTWDESADELVLNLADLKISQGSQIEFIDATDSLTDWTIDNSTDETLLILPTETDDTQTINLGNATNTTDLRLFGATASTVIFDASGDQVTFDAYDVALGDSDTLEFGDSTDTIVQWNGSLFKVDAVTTTAGTALQLETTDGGIHLNADGANNGDILIDAADVLTFTSADTKVFDGAAAETWIIEGTADASEATVIFTDPTADVTWTFPTMGAQTVGVMSTTLATNAPQIANSVWGGSSQLIFEGATANDFETTLAVTDPTADATLTLPDDSGDVAYTPTGGTTYGAGAGALPVTHAYIAYTSVGAAEALTLADGSNGQILVVNHVTDGGDGDITPATAAGFTSVNLAAAGDMVSFVFVDTVGWAILGTVGTATVTP